MRKAFGFFLPLLFFINILLGTVPLGEPFLSLYGNSGKAEAFWESAEAIGFVQCPSAGHYTRYGRHDKPGGQTIFSPGDVLGLPGFSRWTDSGTWALLLLE